MKINSGIARIYAAAAEGKFISFDYTKEDGTTKRRVLKFGGDIAKRLEKSGTPITGKGAWMTGHSSGLRGMKVYYKGHRYVRGTQVNESKHKIFRVDRISNVSIEENK